MGRKRSSAGFEMLAFANSQARIVGSGQEEIQAAFDKGASQPGA